MINIVKLIVMILRSLGISVFVLMIIQGFKIIKEFIQSLTLRPKPT